MTPNCQALILMSSAPPGGWLLLVAGIIGGLGLFLMGIKMMSDNLTKTTGDQVRNLLARFTRNRMVSFLTGIFITMVFQSSSATTVMLVSFVNSRLLKFAGTVGIILGAAIGATITVQIIAFRITDYALVVVAMGFIAYVASRNPRSRSISVAMIGFGILFLGMNLMSQTMEPIKSSPGIVRLLLRLENPWLGILFGALLTALLQSSSAFIGILIILAGQGLITLTAAIPLLIGANIGTAITALLASIGTSRESKRVALAHTLFKATGALIMVWWIPRFGQLVVAISPQTVSEAAMNVVPRQIANAHTVFNTIIALMFLPFTNLYTSLINWLIPDRDRKKSALTAWYIDESLLRTPSLALRVARQEVLRMMEVAQRMTEEIILPFTERKTLVLDRIRDREEELNYLRDAINLYLVRIIRQDVTSDQIEEAYQMMYTVDEYEQIGDIVSGTMKERAVSWCEGPNSFSKEGQGEILEFHLQTLTLLYQAYRTFSEPNLKEAKKSREQYNQFRKQFFDLERQHYERLKMDIEGSAESSRTHLEVIAALKGIGSHATNIARIMLNRRRSSHRFKDKETNSP